MGAGKYILKSFQASAKARSPELRARVSKWRKEKPVMRADGPTNPISAHRLGYRAKKEFIIIRVRTNKGKRRRRAPDLGRKPGRSRKYVEPQTAWRRIAEMKAWRHYRNLTVINSYKAGEDGQYAYWEVIMHDENVAGANERVGRRAKD